MGQSTSNWLTTKQRLCSLRATSKWNLTLDVEQCAITPQPCIRYLGVILDTRLSFKPHVEHAAVKAANVTTALARLLTNIGGPRQSWRKLLASVVISIFTYRIAIWGEALKIKECRKITADLCISAWFMMRPCVLSRERCPSRYWQSRGSNCMSNKVVPQKNKRRRRRTKKPRGPRMIARRKQYRRIPQQS